MTADNAAGNASAAAVAATPNTATSNGIGKYYMMAQGLSALMSVAGGFMGQSAANSEAEQLNMQAELALEEARRDALIRREEVASFKETQMQGYNSSGVLSTEGTPMVMASSTIRKGNREISALTKRGDAIANLLRARSKQMSRSGFSNALGGLISGAGGLGNAFILGKRIGMFGNSQPKYGTDDVPGGELIG